ncbi:TauD/TfdA family dioxygenase [Kitasatospora sp. NBC_01302]|uniref:TauD/TfdA family dioxygenase n=1 Tax=unclassified Kitasatospora TaxID=2633591 RepID=UPI003FA3B96D
MHARLRSAVERHSRRLQLQRGEAFLLDNHRRLHARSAFSGPRQLHRALGDPLAKWNWLPGLPTHQHGARVLTTAPRSALTTAPRIP